MRYPKGTILGASGQPTMATNSYRSDQLHQGWVETPALGQALASPDLFALNRLEARRAARLAYFLNPLIYAGVNIITSFVLGDSFSYGDMEDSRAEDNLAEFWQENDMPMFTERLLVEHLIDGETAVVFPKQKRRRNVTSRIGLLDVGSMFNNVEVKHNTAQGVFGLESVTDGQAIIWNEGEFVWRANDALWNDPRGWPVIMRAVAPALAYISVLNHRVRTHEIQARLNAIYTAVVDMSSPDGGFDTLMQKAKTFGVIPSDGAVATIGKDLTSGQGESLEFTQAARGGADAKSDARMLLTAAAMSLGLPEHYMATLGEQTRTTADTMTLPTRKGFFVVKAPYAGYLIK